MTGIQARYFCDDTFKNEDYDKWSYLLDYAFDKADQVEFNILYPDSDLTKLLADLSTDFIGRGKRTDKIYRSGQFIRYHLTDRTKNFIKSKKYSDWRSYLFEDISFLKNGKEFFATITHENYVILQLTEEQRSILNKKGFNFQYDWGIDPISIKPTNIQELGKSLLDKIKRLFKTSTGKNPS